MPMPRGPRPDYEPVVPRFWAESSARTTPDELTFHMTADCPTSIHLPIGIVNPGDTVTITESDWSHMSPEQRADTSRLITDAKRQEKLLTGHYLRIGEGPEVEFPVGSDPWRHQRRRRWAAAHAIRDHADREAELARLTAHYGSEAQTERDTYGDVTGSIGNTYAPEHSGKPAPKLAP